MFLGAPAGAGAKPKQGKGGVITRETATSGAGDEAILTATATCPMGTRAVGGGFNIPAGDGSFLPSVFDSLRAGQRAWRASAQILDVAPFDPVQLVTYVYCRRGAPKARTVTVTVPAPEPMTVTIGPAATAACGKRRLVAGGFSTLPPVVNGDLSTLVLRSEPAGNAWAAEVISANESNQLSSHAYCADKRTIVGKPTGSKPVRGVRRVSAEIPSSIVAPPRSKVAVSCGSKRQRQARLMLGGGFSQNALLGPGGNYYVTFKSRREGGGWAVDAGQAAPSIASTLRAVGLCGPR